MQLAGIQRTAVINTTVPTMLSLKNNNTLFMLMSSIMSQKRSTTSWTVFSQFPLLQKPWIQGVPSAKMSAESTGEQVSLMLDLQHLLQAFSTEIKDYSSKTRKRCSTYWRHTCNFACPGFHRRECISHPCICRVLDNQFRQPSEDCWGTRLNDRYM